MGSAEYGVVGWAVFELLGYRLILYCAQHSIGVCMT
jgi:hypothetical protein